MIQSSIRSGPNLKPTGLDGSHVINDLPKDPYECLVIYYLSEGEVKPTIARLKGHIKRTQIQNSLVKTVTSLKEKKNPPLYTKKGKKDSLSSH